jgi:sodium/hydrogen antiporter
MYDLILLIVGILALASVALPLLLRERLISFPLVLVAGGALLSFLAFEPGTFDPIARGPAVERLSEFAVIVALTGLGLSIDRRLSWRGWSSTWRLLAITMPLSIAASAWLGWWVVGLAPATAMLFAAALAPTDPVLAIDVQTGPPTTGAYDADEADEVRFALTSESSLNDGLAFPFTYLAILMARTSSGPSDWIVSWFLRDVVWRIGVGVAVGWLVGWLLGRVVLRLIEPGGPFGLLAEGQNPAPSLLVLAITLISYAVTEMVLGYGFIAVFVTAYVVRDSERTSQVHDHLHEGAEQLERLALGVVLVLFGAALSDGLMATITVPMVVVALTLVLVVRPVTGWVALLGERRLSLGERAVVSVFGIRGLGSIYYLAYGLNHATFFDGQRVWSLAAATIVVSLLVHGIGARPAMHWLDRAEPDRLTRLPPSDTQG